jgi:hypothetical protein
MRISPRDPYLGLWHMEMGRALLGLGRTDAVVQEGIKAIDSGYRTVLGYAALAAFYAAADKAPEAKVALAEAIKLNPKFSVAWLDARSPAFIDGLPGFREALIKAGLPESLPPPEKAAFPNCDVHRRETSPMGPSGQPSATPQPSRQRHPVRPERAT